MNPTVSVIVPTYNRAHCLSRALDSILNQTHPINEIIVVDDGSNDHTYELLKQHYPQINYHFQTNQGVSTARNYGIQLAQSPWIALLDSDDAWHPKKIETQFQALRDQPTALCHTNEVWIRHGVRVNAMKKHRKGSDNLFERSLERCLISPSSALIKKDLLISIGLFDEDLPACEDYDLWLRITAHQTTTFVDEALTIKYGGHEDQLSQKHWGMDRFRIASLHKLLQHHNLSKQQQAQTRAVLNKKIQIVLTGARKRQNRKHIQQLEQWLSQMGLESQLV